MTRIKDAPGLSLSTCRHLLGASGIALSDVELTRLRGQLYDLAHCVVPAYERQREMPSADALLKLVPEDDRYQIEERAAVLEFDANMSRDEATRKALATHLQSAKRTNRKSKS